MILISHQSSNYSWQKSECSLNVNQKKPEILVFLIIIELLPTGQLLVARVLLEFRQITLIHLFPMLLD